VPKLLFTTETAKIAADKSREARRLRAEAQANGFSVEPEPDRAYVSLRVKCVRRQIESVNRRIESESDPMRLDRLVNAVYRLTELERVLSGRPLPGQLKPVAQRQVRPEAEPIR